MKVTMILADHAQVADGKLWIAGGGWTVTGPGPVPFGIGLLMEVPWNLTNEQHHFRLELVDIADEASVNELIAFTLEEFGRLDALPDDFTHVFHSTHYLGLDGAPWSDVKLHAAAL